MESIFRDTMADMNWREIGEMGHRDIPILFPVGIMEEHGPHLPLAMDIFLATQYAEK